MNYACPPKTVISAEKIEKITTVNSSLVVRRAGKVQKVPWNGSPKEVILQNRRGGGILATRKPAIGWQERDVALAIDLAGHLWASDTQQP